MDHPVQYLATANLLFARANSTAPQDPTAQVRPSIYKAVGIALAITSGAFIGVSFVLKKIGLLRANEKYEEAAGEGYGYLRNWFWWTGMSLMIIGEICNFVAYAFVDAILVTPLGALSVVVTTILSAIFLDERLSLVGKVGCFLCIIGSVIIVMNAPAESSAANIQEMQRFVIAPGFLSYASVIILGCAFLALWAAPRYGKKSMMVYLSICSLIGGLSVVATQGLGAAIVAHIGGTPQFNQWFLYVLFVFVVMTLVTEIIYLNKALNLFNAALVTPTYYVFFTSSTIITSAILFRGFHGSVTSIITVVNGFLVICAGVSLLQLSKSAKDVPDTAVFAGNLNQVRTIAEQEQPESEPKADAIRGAAAIVRKISSSRQKRELEEARRLHEEKKQDLGPIGESDQAVEVQWDGLRRRTTLRSVQSRHQSPFIGASGVLPSPIQHPPLGMSQFPPEFDSDHENELPWNNSLNFSVLGSITRHRKATLESRSRSITQNQIHNTPQLIPLNSISVSNPSNPSSLDHTCHYENKPSEESLGLPLALKSKKTQHGELCSEKNGLTTQNSPLSAQSLPQSSAGRQFSFQSILRRVSGSTSHFNRGYHVPNTPLIEKKASCAASSKTSAPRGELNKKNLGQVNNESTSTELEINSSSPELHNDEEQDLDNDECNTETQNNFNDGKRDEIVCKVLEEISEEEKYDRDRRKWNDSKISKAESPKPDSDVSLINP